jgi:hypothetical protein
MITKTAVVAFFSKTKVIFASIAAIITFTITLYNQFKGSKTTEISGVVASNRTNAAPVDAIVRISSPVQQQTETDRQGRFRFKLQNVQSDTFLLIVQNKRTNTVAKQNEYVNASRGRTDIVVLFDSTMRDGGVYNAYDTVHRSRKAPSLRKVLQGIFH